MILSKRHLHFYSTPDVVSLEERQDGRFLPVTSVDSSLERGPADVFRYILGAYVHKVSAAVGTSETIPKLQNILAGPTPEEFEGFVSAHPGTGIVIPPALGSYYRIPFRRIEILNERNLSSGADILSVKKARIKVSVGGINSMHIFWSLATLSEYFKTGTLDGPIISGLSEEHATVISTNPGSALRMLCQTATETLRSLGLEWLRPSFQVVNEDLPSLSDSSFSPIFDQYTIKTLSPVSETDIRNNKDEVSTMKFLIDERYNYLSKEYEQGPRSPANKEFDLVPEELLPSSCALSYLSNFYSLKENYREGVFKSRFGFLKRNLTINGKIYEFTREPANVAINLSRNYFKGYARYIKSKLDEETLQELKDEKYLKRNKYIIVDPTVVKNSPNKSQFPLYNQITLTDEGYFNDQSITRDLVNESDEHASSLYQRSMLSLSSIFRTMNGEETLESMNENIFTITGDENALKKSAFSVQDSYGQEDSYIGNINIKSMSFATFLNSLFPSTVIEGFGDPEIRIRDKDETQRSTTRTYFSNLLRETTNPFNIITDEERGSFATSVDVSEFIASLTELISKKARENDYSVLDLLKNKKDYYETFAYKIVKTNLNNNRTQEFFVINTSDDIIEFIDSQIKYEQEYRYDVYSFTLAIGHTYRYFNPVDLDLSATIDAAYDFYTDIEISQKIRILELPIVFENSAVLDLPPIQPNVEFHPVKDSTSEVRIRLSTMSGQELARPLSIEATDVAVFNFNKRYQKRNDGLIRFGQDELPMAFEIFRITSPPTSLRDFASSKRTVLCADDKKQANGVLFGDTIQSNLDYYYVFRTLDHHGNISNPTNVFKFTLAQIEGALQPLLETIPIADLKQKTDLTKGFRKFLQVRPSFRQTQMAPLQFKNKTSNQISSVFFGIGRDLGFERAVFAAGSITDIHNPALVVPENNSILNNRFLFKVESKTSGKILYFEVNYTDDQTGLISEPVEEITVADAEAVVARRRGPRSELQVVGSPEAAGATASAPPARLPGNVTREPIEIPPLDEPAPGGTGRPTS